MKLAEDARWKPGAKLKVKLKGTNRAAVRRRAANA